MFFHRFSSCACRDVNFFICVSSMCLSAIHSESRFSKNQLPAMNFVFSLIFAICWPVRACVCDPFGWLSFDGVLFIFNTIDFTVLHFLPKLIISYRFLHM
jgi:hypothetical protein